eukprot:TRINITY_DN31361_c0_g1_i1.p1 TRINITY_DN31361_c0_g1~~TRINITY_DN31361_c0_g1_i1.p1  ORF type:complete len:268 (-),score=39.03 TRINITY_DN31361_c0_g1_i1:82-813(-)
MASLQYKEPPPLVLGAYPLTRAVEVICGLHGLLCLFVICTASSVAPIQTGSLVVPTQAQVGLAAWCVLGVTCIVGALESCRSRTEFGMKAYFYYFLLSSAPAIWLLWHSLTSEDICRLQSIDRQLQRVSEPLSCAMLHTLWFFGALGVFVVLTFAAHVIWDLKDYLREREASEDLIRHEDPMLQKLRAGFGQAGDEFPSLSEELSSPTSQDWRNSGANLDDARPQLGPQPAWGQLPIAARVTA